MFKTSPTPWGAWDKHAFLYDADENCIAEFNSDEEKWPHGSKAAVDLTNRNRAAACVNALEGIDDPYAFMEAVRAVARGEEASNCLCSWLSKPEEDEG